MNLYDVSIFSLYFQRAPIEFSYREFGNWIIVGIFIELLLSVEYQRKLSTAPVTAAIRKQSRSNIRKYVNLNLDKINLIGLSHHIHSGKLGKK